MTTYKVVKFQHIIGGVAAHNGIVFLRPDGTVIREMNGLATRPNGEPNDFGWTPRDMLKGRTEPQGATRFYSADDPQVVLFEGSALQIDNYFKAAQNVEQIYNDKVGRYPWLAVLGPNSNAYASTVIRGMGLPDTKVSFRLAPSEGTLLLDETSLHTIAVNWQTGDRQPVSVIRRGESGKLYRDLYVFDEAGNAVRISGESLTIKADVSTGRAYCETSDGKRIWIEIAEGGEQKPAGFDEIASVGDIIGSSIGNYLADGNIAKSIVFSSLLGEVGERLGIAIATGSLSAALDLNIRQVGSDSTVAVATARNMSIDVAARMQSAAVGTFSSLLAMELGEAMGLQGFGAELFNTTGSAVINKAFTNVLSNPADPFSGFNVERIGDGFGSNAFEVGGAGTLAISAIGSFLGAKLGAMVVSPQTQAGVALSSVGSAVGSYVAVQLALQGGLYQLTLLGNLIVPGVGAFVGFVLGALIGNLFGSKKPRTPTAFAETVLQLPFARYELGATGSENNGNVGLVTSMAVSARDTLNGLIAAVAGMDRLAYVSNLNGQATDHRYGQRVLADGTSTYFIRFGANGVEQTSRLVNGVATTFTSPDQVVEFGALTAIRNTKIIGGDIFAKRAIARSAAADLTSMAGDLQIASDYGFYANNRELVNGLIHGAYGTLTNADEAFYETAANKAKIDKLMVQGYDALTQAEKDWYNVPATKATVERIAQALEDQNLANPWIITLQRVSEIGLDKFAPSDFHGGLRGFMDSFDLTERGLGYEAISVASRTDGSVVIEANTLADGLFSILPQALDGPVRGDIYNADFSQALSGWSMESNVSNAQHGVNYSHQNSTTGLTQAYSGNGNNVLWSNMPGTPAVGALTDIRSELIASTAGVVYEASVYAAQHRGDVNLIIEWYNASGTRFAQSLVGGAAYDQSGSGGFGGDLAKFNRISGTAVAPPGAVSRVVILELKATSAAAGQGAWGFFTRPETRVSTGSFQQLSNPNFANVSATPSGGIPGGWSLSTSVAEADRGHGVNRSGFSGSDNDVLWSHMEGASTAVRLLDISSGYLPTTAGVWYQDTVMAAQSGGTASLRVLYYDASYQLIGNQVSYSGATVGGGVGGDLSTMTQIGGDHQAPAGAVFRRIILRNASVGASEIDPYAYFSQPISRPLGTGVQSWTQLYGTDNWDSAGEAVRIENFATSLGYTLNPSAATANPDLIDRRTYTNAQALNGLAGDDIMVGGQAGDVLVGQEGWDWIDGGAGNDRLEGHNDQDVLIGGTGVDKLIGGFGDDYLAGGEGNERWEDGDGALLGGAGNDTLIGGGGMDSLVGGDGDDLLLVDQDGGATRDGLEGDAGSDTGSFERWTQGVVVNFTNQRVTGTTDSITSYGDQWFSVENVTGGAYNDILTGDEFANVLKGGAGNDTLAGMAGDDIIEGGVGADIVNGWGGWDTASYAGSEARVSVDLTTKEAFGGDAEGDNGFYQIEHLRGSRHADELKGSTGANILEGGGGNDWLIASGGADTFKGGEGADTADFSQATAAMTADLANAVAGTGQAAGVTYDSVEQIVGSAFADTLRGTTGDDLLDGAGGHDLLYGSDGSDAYVLGRSYGSDTVSDNNSLSNTILVDSSVRVGELYQEQQGGAAGFLNIGVRGAQLSKISVLGNFGPYPISNANIVKSIDFGGAGQLDVSKIDAGQTGSTNSDNITGASNKYDMIFGYEGNDILRGAAAGQTEMMGNVIIGGIGNDTIYTSGGDDQFAFDYGDGVDTIWDTGGAEVLVFGASVTADDVIIEIGTGSNYDLYIGLRDAANPNLTASQVSNRIIVKNGGKIIEYTDTNQFEHNTLEYIQAGGSWINLKTMELNWNLVMVHGNGSQTSGSAGPRTSPTQIPPIIFDLNGDGLSLNSVAESNVVSRSASGALFRVGWAGPTDGMLAVDRNADGVIDRISEISFSGDKAGAETDLEGLTAWDTNADGLISSADERFGELRIWVDRNQNGRSSDLELQTMAEAGISTISLSGQRSGIDPMEQTDSFVQETVTFTRADGSEGHAYDVALARRFLHGDSADDVRDPTLGWDEAQGDGEFGRLLNEPLDTVLTVAGQSVINGGQEVLVSDLFGSDDLYEAVVGSVQLDFGDADTLYAEDETRWADALSGVERPAFVEVDGANQAKQTAAAYEALVEEDTGSDLPIELPIDPTLSSGQPGEIQDLGEHTAASTTMRRADGVSDEEKPTIMSMDEAADILNATSVGSIWAEEGSAGIQKNATLGSNRWWLEGVEHAAGHSSPRWLLIGEGSSQMQAEYLGLQAAQQQQLRQAMAGFGSDNGSAPAIWQRQLGLGAGLPSGIAGSKAAVVHRLPAPEFV